jgi:pimeloyl-ACP methyl ester carboxylesterase
MNTIKVTTIFGYTARYLHIYNANKPSLILLPGAFMNFDSLKYHSSRLSQNFNYFILELPGTGDLSPLPVDKPVSFLGDCLSYFAQNHIAKPFYLLACSYGTAAALDFASKNSHLLKRLILAGSMRNIPESDWPKMLDITVHSLTDKEAFAEQSLKIVCSDKCFSKRQQAIRKVMLNNARQFSAERRRSFANNTLRLLTSFVPKVEQIHCPTLCITGEYDCYTTPELCKELADSIPQGEFINMADTDHMFIYDKPRESMDIIMQFLTKELLPMERVA